MIVNYGADRPFPGVPLELDRTNPLTEGLVSCVPALMGYGALVDIARMQPSSITLTAANYDFEGMLPTDSIYGQFTAPSSKVDNCSAAIWHIWNGVTDPDAMGLIQVGNDNGYAIMCTNTPVYNLFHRGVAFDNPFGSTAPSANVWTHIGVRRKNGTWTGFINGVAKGTSSSTPSTPGGLLVGAIKDPSTRGWNGKLRLACVWDRPLEDDEFMELYTRPYSMFGYEIPDYLTAEQAASFLAAWAQGSNVLITPGIH